jgi:hypothetical protein
MRDMYSDKLVALVYYIFAEYFSSYAKKFVTGFTCKM